MPSGSGVVEVQSEEGLPSSSLGEALLFLVSYGLVSADVAACNACTLRNVHSALGGGAPRDSRANADQRTSAPLPVIQWIHRAIHRSCPVSLQDEEGACLCCLHVHATAFGRAALLSSLSPEDACIHAHEAALIAQSGLATDDPLPSLFLLVPSTIEARAAPQDASAWGLQGNLLLHWARGERGALLHRGLGCVGVTPELLLGAMGGAASKGAAAIKAPGGLGVTKVTTAICGPKARNADASACSARIPLPGSDSHSGAGGGAAPPPAAPASASVLLAPQVRQALLRRWFIAVLLRDLTEQEADVPVLVAKYGAGTLLDGGLVQSIQVSVGSLGGAEVEDSSSTCSLRRGSWQLIATWCCAYCVDSR